jgi:oxalate decarboxylase/phosphoglucose isomerase-like protein (cupin superfamily)
MDIKLINFQEYVDKRGNLVVAEYGKEIPFLVRRIYYIYGVPEGEKRGFHSHKRLRQVYIAIHGSCEVMLTSGEDKKTIKLESPAQGLYIGNDVWREIYNFSTDAVLLVLASEEYSEDDYIRKYDKFIESVEGKK